MRHRKPRGRGGNEFYSEIRVPLCVFLGQPDGQFAERATERGRPVARLMTAAGVHLFLNDRRRVRQGKQRSRKWRCCSPRDRIIRLPILPLAYAPPCSLCSYVESDLVAVVSKIVFRFLEPECEISYLSFFLLFRRFYVSRYLEFWEFSSHQGSARFRYFEIRYSLPERASRTF